MRLIRRFGQFWYDFLVGDDWTAAAGVVVALGITALLADGTLNPWWLLPIAVTAIRAGAPEPPDLTEPPFE